MTFCLFITYEAKTRYSAQLAEGFESESCRLIGSIEGIEKADLFVPDSQKVMFFDDGPAPATMLQIEAPRIGPLEQLAAEEKFKTVFLDEPLERVPDARPSFGVFKVISYPVYGENEVMARTAPMSFVVRYYGPMREEKTFQDFYVANHLPVLSKLPEIRNIFAYLPVPWRNSGLPESEVVLGNEVVFDDVDALVASFKSEAISEVRKDSSRFPPFGHSTHHTLQRRTVDMSLLAGHFH